MLLILNSFERKMCNEAYKIILKNNVSTLLKESFFLYLNISINAIFKKIPDKSSGEKLFIHYLYEIFIS